MGPLQQAALSTATASLSPLDLFLMADWIVKSVMLTLLGMSIYTWSVVIQKVRLMRRVESDSAAFTEAFWNTPSLDILYQQLNNKPKEPQGAVFCSAMKEWALGKHTNHNTWMERVERVMRVTISRELDTMQKSLSFLAITGSSAPFIGLFGTVWGIMNSFIAISGSKNASIAVVGPGLAEALLATAIGLVAAIPAGIAYNRLTSRLEQYSAKLESFSDEVMTALLRQPGA